MTDLKMNEEPRTNRPSTATMSLRHCNWQSEAGKLRGILTLVSLSTIEEVKADPLGPIWFRPFDYREASRGTPFDPLAPREQFG
jgi:hypothetical protein